MWVPTPSSPSLRWGAQGPHLVTGTPFPSSPQVSRLKQALQDSQAERESALLDKEVLLQRLHNLEQEMETKKRSQDDRSRHAKALEVGERCGGAPKPLAPFLQCCARTARGRAGPAVLRPAATAREELHSAGGDVRWLMRYL